MPSDTAVNDIAVRGDRLTRRFATPAGTVLAVDDVDVEIATASLTAVAGPSGSGKSVLLSMISCTDRPSLGTVRVGDVRVTQLGRRARRRFRREQLGIVLPQPSDNLLLHMSAIENARWAMRVRRGRRGHDAVDEQARELMDAVGIGDLGAKQIRQLSGGEQQRLALVCALMGEPAVLVADEPTASLDAASSIAVVEALRALADRGVTMIVATHDHHVIDVADTVIRLDHGAPRRMSTLVVVDAVEKHWDATSGLRALTLEVREHELVVVRGRSGTGKSTLLSILAGWCEPDRGAVTWGPSFDGCDVTAWDQVAVVPQVLALMAELSGARERRDRASGVRHHRGGRDRASERGARVVAAHRARRASARRDLARATAAHRARPRRRRRAQAPARGRAHESSGCGERAGGSWRSYGIEPRSAAACWSRPTRRCSWMPPTGSSPSTTTDRQGPVSLRAYANAWRRESVNAVPFHAMSNAVPWSTEVRTIGNPSVTFTPSSNASSFIGA